MGWNGIKNASPLLCVILVIFLVLLAQLHFLGEIFVGDHFVAGVFTQCGPKIPKGLSTTEFDWEEEEGTNSGEANAITLRMGSYGYRLVLGERLNEP